jgi:hypothetical protein
MPSFSVPSYFPCAAGACLAKVHTALAAISVLLEADDAFFVWIGTGTGGRGKRDVLDGHAGPHSDDDSEGGNVLGGVEITPTEIVVTSNSRARIGTREAPTHTASTIMTDDRVST